MLLIIQLILYCLLFFLMVKAAAKKMRPAGRQSARKCGLLTVGADASIAPCKSSNYL